MHADILCFPIQCGQHDRTHDKVEWISYGRVSGDRVIMRGRGAEQRTGGTEQAAEDKIMCQETENAGIITERI